MSDDDFENSPTPDKPGRWGDAKRATVGRDRRMSDSERGRRIHGVPVVRLDDGEPPDTSPVDILDREPDEEVRAVVQKSRRNPGDHATVEDIAALMLSSRRHRKRDESSISEARKVLAMLPSPVELQQMRTKLATFEKVAIAIILAVLGTLGTVAKGLYDRGGHDAAADLRIERLERDVQHLERMSEREPPTPPFPTQKGPTP